jgi:glycosyltransferase involved in cell wall biosynthesis
MSGSGLTVLHYVGYDADAGGIVSVVRALATAQRFECVLGVNRGFTSTQPTVLPFLEFPRIAGEQISPTTFWRARSVARAVRAWLQVGQGRIFHGHSRAGLLVGLWLRRMGEQRVVVSVHCYGHQRWFYRWAAGKLPGRLFWLSPAMKNYYFEEAGAGDWSECIPGCVPGAAIGLPLARPKNVPALNRFHLAGVGALVPWKGWDLVLAALAELPPVVRAKIRFTHIGAAQPSESSRRYAAELRARTGTLGLQDCVEWRGQQASADDLLRASDALVIAADHEPFSVAMLEALAAGVPVLAADSGGATDVIVPPRNGWLFRSGDARDLAARLRLVLEGGALAQVAIDGSAVQRFSATNVAEQWLAVYEDVSLRD